MSRTRITPAGDGMRRHAPLFFCLLPRATAEARYPSPACSCLPLPISRVSPDAYRAIWESQMATWRAFLANLVIYLTMNVDARWHTPTVRGLGAVWDERAGDARV